MTTSVTALTTAQTPSTAAAALKPRQLVQPRLWLPFTQMTEFDAPARTFVRGEGNTLFDSQGRQLFDAISSVWTILHGHCRREIIEAITAQACTLDHSTLLGATHPRAEELAERLCAMTGLARSFFASDGASAVEVALKIALQYWQQIGQPQRTRFVHLVDSYHGDTAAAMSVSDIAVFKSRFSAITFETSLFEDVSGDEDVAAFIVEPIVQAAAGMKVVPWERYATLKDRSALLIVDEIATGFGRTGTLFAHEQLELRPDVLCLGKSITGGALALSATMVSEQIYDAFLGRRAESKHLFHGHSYAGNPIACAAALASLDLLDHDRSLQHVSRLAAILQSELRSLKTLRRIRDVRCAGLMCGIELDAEQFELADLRSAGWSVADAMYERGHFTRPIGDVIQFVPPLSTTESEVRAFCRDLIDVLSG